MCAIGAIGHMKHATGVITSGLDEPGHSVDPGFRGWANLQWGSLGVDLQLDRRHACQNRAADEFNACSGEHKVGSCRKQRDDQSWMVGAGRQLETFSKILELGSKGRAFKQRANNIDKLGPTQRAAVQDERHVVATHDNRWPAA